MICSLTVGSFFTINYIALLAAAGIGMAGQQRQQVVALLDFNFLNLMRLDNLDVRYCISQGFPQVRELHGIAYSQSVNVPEVIRAAPASVPSDNAVGVVAADGC